MCAGLVVKLDGNADNGSALGGEVGAKLLKRLGRRGNGGRDCAVGWLAELRFEAADDGDDTGSRAKRPQQKFTAGSLGERKLCASVNGAEMVEILRASRESKKLRRFGSRLDAEKAVEREFCDALLQVTGSS